MRPPLGRGIIGRGALGVVLAAFAGAASAGTHEPGRVLLCGRPLSEALQELQSRGLRVVFSSDVVRADMIVEEEPSAVDPRGVLREILAPHPLEARDGPGGTVLIVPRGPTRAGPAEDTPPRRPSGAPPDPLPVRERVIVTPGREAADAAPEAARVIRGDDLRRASTVGDDAQRALAAQPGIVAGDRSAEIRVRGGAPDEVRVVFDGLELYDPFHLKGFHRFSGIVDAMTVTGAEYFPGALPVEYGDRMSGVVDLSSAIADAPGRTLLGGSFVNSRLMTQGSFIDSAGRWLVSAREWHPDAVVRTLDPNQEEFGPSYGDVLGKVEFPVGDGTLVTGSFLAALDELDVTEEDRAQTIGADSATRYAWIRLRSVWSARLHSATVFSVGRLRSERDGRIDRPHGASATIRDHRAFSVTTLAQDWSYEATGRVLVKWGGVARWVAADYMYASRWTEADASGAPSSDPAGETWALTPSGRQSGAHVGGVFRPYRGLRIDAGARWDAQSYTGERQVSPRVGVVYELTPAARARLAWGRYHQSQGIHELQVEDGVTRFSPAQSADQWTLGYEHDLPGGLSLRADLYSKRIASVRPRFENLLDPFQLFPELAPDRVLVAPDRSRARGIELTLARGATGRFAWWGSYSRSAIEDLLDGAAVPRSWDQPHAFQFGLDWRTAGAWSLSLAGIYHSGWPRTPVGATMTAEVDGGTTFETTFGARNSARHSPYHRLDLRASRGFNVGRGRVTVFAEISNVYDRQNACCIESLAFEPRADGTVRVAPEAGWWRERVPSLGFAWEFDR